MYECSETMQLVEKYLEYRKEQKYFPQHRSDYRNYGIMDMKKLFLYFATCFFFINFYAFFFQQDRWQIHVLKRTVCFIPTSKLSHMSVAILLSKQKFEFSLNIFIKVTALCKTVVGPLQNIFLMGVLWAVQERQCY